MVVYIPGRIKPNRHMPELKAITLDLAGTLLFPYPSVGAVYASCALRHDIRVSAEILEKDFHNAYAHTPKKLAPEVFWRAVVLSTFGEMLPAEKADEVVAECWRAFGDEKAWKVAPGTISALTALRFLGLKVAVLSNADSRLHNVLKTKKLSQYFDAIFLSSEIGLTKPDARSYKHCADSLGVAVTALAHAGDNPEEDGQGALTAGAVGIIVGGRHAPTHCLRAEKISDLPFVVRAYLTEGKQKGKFSRSVQNLLANLRGVPEDRGRSTTRNTRTIDDALSEVFQKFRFDRVTPEDTLIAQWHHLLPLKLAKRCAPQKVQDGGKLIIQCESSIVKTEVQFHAKAMLAKIKLLPGCQGVRQIQFVSA